MNTTDTPAAENRSSTASWRAHAEKIDTPKGLTLGEVAQRTGVAAGQITFVMLRRVELKPTAVMAPLARPAYDLAGEPRWDESQVVRYFELLEQRNRPLPEVYEELPRKTQDEANAAGLLSLRRMSDVTGVHLTTIHRWHKRADWPAPAALILNASPTPYLVWEWSTIRGWLHSHVDELPALRGVDVAKLPEQLAG